MKLCIVLGVLGHALTKSFEHVSVCEYGNKGGKPPRRVQGPDVLAIPAEAAGPKPEYLEFHRNEVFVK
ncbi:MAG: hypothetical protein H6592_01035 [Flavobacteriales bacterium]|nr:hypothetical protein [Flavobacteriales bacterium]